MAQPPYPDLHGDADPQVGVVFGSVSDWPTMEAAVAALRQFDIPVEYGVVSAHRTPDRLRDYATAAVDRGLRVIVAGAGGAAHLPGMLAAWTVLPVFGVPVQSKALAGVDSLHSIVQMPGGVPVGTLAIGTSGARNAGLLAARVLATQDQGLRQKLLAFHESQAKAALAADLPPLPGKESKGP